MVEKQDLLWGLVKPPEIGLVISGFPDIRMFKAVRGPRGGGFAWASESGETREFIGQSTTEGKTAMREILRQQGFFSWVLAQLVVRGVFGQVK